MGGSSKKVTVGYRYYLGVHMVFCHGPVDRLLQINVDKRPAWLGYSAGGQININSPQLFGGESREGGVSGTVDFETGSSSQGQNSYLSSKLGSSVPSFRGVVGLVLRQCYMGINPYLKNWSARLQRIHTRQNGLTQWYDAKSQIGVATRVVDINLTVANAGTDPNVGYLLDNVKATDFVVIFRPDEVMTYTAMRGWPADHTDPLPWGHLFTVTGSDGSSTLHWYEWFATAEDALNYAKAQAPVVRSGSTSYRIHIPDGNLSDNAGGESLRIIIASQLDMNPAHILRECLTDPDWGMGYAEADIDDASFQAAADTLYSESMGISILWDKQIPLEDFIKEIMRHIDATLYVDRKTGKFVLKLIRHNYIEANLLVLGEDQIERVEGYSRPAFGELVNSVTVNYWDSVTNGEASITADDPALIQMQGAVIGTTIQYPGFTNGTIASKVAMRDLKSLSIPRLSCTIYANKSAADLNIGDPFLFEWPDYHEGQIVMRVTGLGLGDGKSNKVRLTCVQDVFDLPQIAVVSPSVPDWVDPTVDPTPAQYRSIVEAPYFELVQRLGQTTVDNQLGSNIHLGYILASAAAPSGAINGRLAIDSGDGYDGNDTAMDFCPVAFLAEDMSQGQTVVMIADGQSLSAVAIGTHAQIGNELVKVMIVTDTTLTVGRGVLDTVPAAHVAGTPILFWDAYADSDNVEYIAGESVDVKILPTTGNGTLSAISAPTDVLVFDSRAYRPYPPGNLKIGGEAYPKAIGGSEEMSLTWSHRDRLQQTAGDIIDTTAGNIGPEIGTSYNLRIYGEADTLIREVTGLTATSYTYLATNEMGDSELLIDGDPFYSFVTSLLHFDGTDGSTVINDVKGNTWTAYVSAQLDTARSKFGDSSVLFDTATEENQYYGAHILFLACDGTNGSTTVPDYSAYKRTVTCNGSAAISTTQSKFGGASVYIPAGSYLSVAYHPTMLLPGDFTIDFWVRPDAIGATQNLYDHRPDTSGSACGVIIQLSAAGTIRFAAGDSDTASFNVDQTGSTVIGAGAWSHIAFTRTGNTFRGFVNGVLQFTSTPSAFVIATGTTDPYIGIHRNTSLNNFAGYVDEVRVLNICLYTASFTPPTTRQIYGALQDKIQSGPAAAYGFGTGDFTLEGWFYIPTLNTYNNHVLFDFRASPINYGHVYVTSSGQVALSTAVSDGEYSYTNQASGVSEFPLDQWNHVALVRHGNTITAYINGVAKVSGDYTGADHGATGVLTIGNATWQTAALRGWVDEVAVTKAARYTANFTPPVIPFSDTGASYRLNGKLRISLESQRDGYNSYQAHDYTVLRQGYGFNYGEIYGGI